MNRHIHLETYRQEIDSNTNTIKWTDRQNNNHIYRQNKNPINRQKERQAGSHKHIQRDRQANEQTERITKSRKEIYTCTNVHNYKQIKTYTNSWKYL
jgi:hypothetical protein